jgi:hypothetical protein
MSSRPLMVLALVGVGAWIVKSQAPEIQRYLRVRQM